MIGYPITYGDILEKGNGLVLTGISEYWSSAENRANFIKGYKFGLLVFGISGVLLTSTTVFASDDGIEILALAKSGKKKSNQQFVINRLKEIYG